MIIALHYHHTAPGKNSRGGLRRQNSVDLGSSM